MYCEKHDRRWDSDRVTECPDCEDEVIDEANPVEPEPKPKPWWANVACLFRGHRWQPLSAQEINAIYTKTQTVAMAKCGRCGVCK